MTALVVAAILLTIAVPSFLGLMVSSRLATSADSVVSAIDAARMAATSNTSAGGNTTSGEVQTVGGVPVIVEINRPKSGPGPSAVQRRLSWRELKL